MEEFWTHRMKQLDSISKFRHFNRSEARDNSIRVVLPDMTWLYPQGNHAESGILVYIISVFGALISKYASRNLVCIETPILKKASEAVPSNAVVPLLFSVDRNLTVREYLNNVRRNVGETYKHQHFPIQEATGGIKRGFSNIGIFYKGLHAESLSGKSDHDLIACIEKNKEGLAVTLNYRSGAFCDGFMDHFAEELEEATQRFRHFDHKLSEIMAEEEALSIVAGKSIPLGDQTSVHQLFEKQAQQQPSHRALIFNRTSLTYQALNDQAERLAGFLQNKAGLTRGDRVGIYMSPSPPLMVSLLAVLKAGGCYVPLDKYSPTSRINYILQNAETSLLLTDEATDFIVPKSLVVNDLLKEVDELNRQKVEGSIEDLAYIIYTSGTTGQPKGVPLTHRNVINALQALNEEYQIRGGKHILNASISFDASVKQMFVPLMVGGELHLFEDLKDIAGLMRYVEANKIQYLHASPTVWENMLQSLQHEDVDLSSLVQISSGGERLASGLLNKLKRSFDGKIYNTYGPTETTINATVQEVSGKDRVRNHPAIGKPLPNYKAFVLGEDDQPLPKYAVGEIGISGPSVSRGYVNTSEVYPLVKYNGDIIYKTGDSGFLDARDQLHYQGRKDGQLKIRGFRIEPQEIVNALLRYSSIESVVVSPKDHQGEQVLVAYYTGEKQVTQDIKSWLSSSLPTYMIPDFFIHLEALPLGITGKVDHDNLPWPPAQESVIDESQLTTLEKQLLSIYRRVLGFESITVHDDFFQIGGHSLKATQLMHHIQKELEVKIDLNYIFLYPTVEQLATNLSTSATSKYVAIEPLAPADYYDVSYHQKRQWIVDQNEKEQLTYNMLGAYVLKGNISPELVESAFIRLIERHEILRTTFHWIDGQLKQRIHEVADYPFRFDHLDFSGSSPQDQFDKYINDEEKRPFDLESGPLLRAALVKLNDDQHVLVGNFDHITVDGTSISILIREWSEVYKALSAAQEPELTDLRIQYKDYAAWHKARMASSIASEHEAYWRNKLLPLPAKLNLPRDKSGWDQTFEGKNISFVLHPDELSLLKKSSQEQGATLYMSLITVLNILLYKLCGNKDITVGTGVAGRENIELENQVGLFANILALRNNINEQDTYQSVLEKVKQTSVQAYRHQEYQFVELVDRLGIDMSEEPLFEVMFLLQNYEASDLKVDNAEIEEYKLNHTTGLFDLFFNARESDQQLDITLTYNHQVFETETIERIISYFRQIAGQVTKLALEPLENIVLEEHPLQKEISSLQVSDKSGNRVPPLVIGNVHFRDRVTGQWTRTNDHARWNSSGTLEILSESPQGVWDGTNYFSTSEIEKSLMKRFSLKDCKLVKNIRSSFYTLFIAGAQEMRDQVEIYLAAAFSDNLARQIEIDTINNLPLDANGAHEVKSLIAGQYPLEKELDDVCVALEEKLVIDRIKAVHKEISPSRQYLYVEDFTGHTSQKEDETYTLKNASHSQTTVAKPAYAEGYALDSRNFKYKTLVEALVDHAHSCPTNGLTLIQGEGEEAFISFEELLWRARAVLYQFQRAGLTQGDKVILQVEDFTNYFSSYWACIIGKIIPITIAIPPTYAPENPVVNKIYEAWKLLDHCHILTEEHLLAPLRALDQHWGGTIQTLIIKTPKSSDTLAEIAEVHPEDVMFFQLSSGSTGVPKAVQIQHKGVVNQVNGVQKEKMVTCDTVSMNWLPYDHVGALLMWHLRDLYFGAHQIIAKTEVILANPLRWLDYIEKYKVNLTWSPNFGYKLLTDELERKKTNQHWDLSSLRITLSGGEQVTPGVLERLFNSLAPYGYQPHMAVPAYGMAEVCTENTSYHDFSIEEGTIYIKKESLDQELVLSSQEDKDTYRFISVGVPIGGTQLRIADTENHVLLERRIGRIQFRSESVTIGYYKNSEENRKALLADGWYNTGDLGFLHDGKLYVTGREKEMIIIRGSHYYYYELEDLVGKLPGVLSTFIGACGVNNGETEELAIFFSPEVFEWNYIYPCISGIRSAINEKFGIFPRYVIPTAQKKFPKTTSGKIQRTRLKKNFEVGKFSQETRKIDLHFQDSKSTFPNIFLKKKWIKKQRRTQDLLSEKKTLLIFCHKDQINLWKSKARFQCYFVVSGGDSYTITGNVFTIDPKQKSHYEQLAEDIDVDITDVVHAWTCQQQFAKLPNEDSAEHHHEGIYSLLYCAKYLLIEKRSLLVLSSQSLWTDEISDTSLDHAVLPGFLKSLKEEAPEMNISLVHASPACKHIEQQVLQEVNEVGCEPEIAYNSLGYRYVSRLQSSEAVKGSHTVTILQGGFYLITGGLGALGYELCSFLLQTYHAKLLLIGRTMEADLSEDKKDRLHQLSTQGDVLYKASNVAKLRGLRMAVSRAEDTFQQKLDGVFHLAGHIQDVSQQLDKMDQLEVKALETVDFEQMFEAKVSGTLALGELLTSYSDAIFVAYSSALSFLGGYASAPYAAANSFLDSYLSHRANTGRAAKVLNWSVWGETGVNKNSPHVRMLENKGIMNLATQQALRGLEIALQMDDSQILIGLDENHLEIAKYLTFRPKAYEVHLFTGKNQSDQKKKSMRSLLSYRYPGLLAEVHDLDDSELENASKSDLLKILNQKEKAFEQHEQTESQEETALKAIWRELLNKERIDRIDNFFESGGHSLHAMQLIARIADQFGVKLNLSNILSYPTLQEQLHLILDKMKPGAIPIKIPKAASDLYYAITPAQKQIWITHQINENLTAYNVPAAYQLKGELDVKALENAFRAHISRHEILRTTFQIKDNAPVQIIHTTDELRFTMGTLDFTRKTKPYERAVRYAIKESNRAFNLEKGPLLRVTLLKVAADKHILLFITHHIISDGWSVGIQMKEIIELYDSIVNESAINLPVLEIQFKDYAAWINDHWQKREEVNRDFWKAEFTDGGTLELPTDFVRPNIRTFAGARVSGRLEAEEVEKLLNLAEDLNISFFSLQLALVYTLLYAHSSQKIITIGFPYANRTHKQLENLVGFFVNIVPFKTALVPEDDFSTLARKIYQHLSIVLDHADYPFDLIVKDRREETDPSRFPLFDVVVQNQDVQRLHDRQDQLAGIEVQDITLDHSRSKYDITFNFFYDCSASVMDLDIEFNTDLYKQKTIEEILKQLQSLVLIVLHQNPTLSNMRATLLNDKQEVKTYVEQINAAISESF